MINELLKASRDKKKGKADHEIYDTAYYSLGGLVTGIILVELWQKLNLPGFDEKITTSIINHQPIENTNAPTVDKFVMMAISTGLILSELFGVKGGAASGGGLMLGYTFMSQSSKGKYIGQT